MKFLPAQLSWIWRMSKQKCHPLKYFPLECNLIPAASYRATNGFTFQIINIMNGILTWFDGNSSFRNLCIILSDLRFHNTFQFVKYGASAWFFSLLSAQNEVNEICIGNSMICSDIWHKYDGWYFETVTYYSCYIFLCIIHIIHIVIHFISDNFEIPQVVFMPNIWYKSCYYLFILLPAKGL